MNPIFPGSNKLCFHVMRQAGHTCQRLRPDRGRQENINWLKYNCFHRENKGVYPDSHSIERGRKRPFNRQYILLARKFFLRRSRPSAGPRHQGCRAASASRYSIVASTRVEWDQASGNTDARLAMLADLLRHQPALRRSVDRPPYQHQRFFEIAPPDVPLCQP